MIAFISFLISINYLSSHAFSVISTTAQTPIGENWLNGSTSVPQESNIKILYGRNLSRAATNSIPSFPKTNLLNHDIRKRSLRNYYGKKRPNYPLHRKRKYATKFTGLTNFIFDGIIDFDQKRSLPSKSPLQFKTVNSLNNDPNKYYNTDPLHQEKTPNSKDKSTHEQFSDFLPVVNSGKIGFAKTATFKPLNKENPYNADKTSNEFYIPPTRQPNTNIPNLDLIYANGNFNELKLKPQASEMEQLSTKNENHSNETILTNDFLNSPEYEKALMLRKTNKVEMLINNQNLIKDMVKYALGKGVYPALVALEGESNDPTGQEESEAKGNPKPSLNYDERPSQNDFRKYQSHENPYSNEKNVYPKGQTISHPKYYHHPESQEHPSYYKHGAPTNKNNNMNKQFENNGQPPNAIKNEMGYNKVQNVEDEKGFRVSYSDNKFQVSKSGGTDIGQEHKGEEFPGSLPYTGGNKAAKSNGTNSYNFGHHAPFQEFEESKMNVGRVQQIVLLKTEPVSYKMNQNNGEDKSNEENVNNYEIPESVNQFQIKPNSRVDAGQKPQNDVKNAWIKPNPHSNPTGNQPISIPQNANSEPKGIHIPKRPPEELLQNNNNNYKIEENMSEKKIKTSQEITEYVMKEPENPPEQKNPPSSLYGKPGIEEVGGESGPKKTKLTKTFFAEEGGPPKNLPEGGVALFGNLTEVEFLPLSNKNVSRTILIREETEYVLDKGPSTMTPPKTVTLADYSAYNPPVVNPREQEDQVVDPTMMRMHVRPFKKKVPLVQENFRKRRYGSYHSPDQEDRKVIIYPMRAAVRRVRRQIDGSEASCCYNGGTCIADGEHKSCLCEPAYTGQFCETPVDECLKAKKVCKEHEVCTNHNGEFSCSCALNFVKEGDDCIPSVTCEEFPCLNGGECQDAEDGGFICKCELGFIGRTCSKRVPECEDSSCSNEEVCVSTEIGYKCVKKTEIDTKL